jgi:hypothetical protein
MELRDALVKHSAGSAGLRPENDESAARSNRTFPGKKYSHLSVKSVFVRQMIVGNGLLTARTRFPECFRRLISADMYVFRREKLRDFGQHIFHNAVNIFVARTRGISNF